MERMANRRPPWFWWLLILILSSCFAILTWSLCISIFNHPEIPRNYEILRKLGRLPEPKAYTSQTAPEHPAGSATDLRKSYVDFSDKELKTLNTSLLHSYLTNFREHSFCTYLVGPYKVLSSRKLTKDDIITEGFALQLRAYKQPDEYTELSPYPIVAEIIIPTPYADSHKGYHRGDMLELSITPHFTSLLNVDRVSIQDDETIVILTAVSLANRLRPPHEGPFDLAPPTELKLDAHFPIFPKNSVIESNSQASAEE